MIPTVEQVKDRAAFHLGDPTRRKFTHEKLQEAFASAFEEIYTHLLNYQISTVELIATYTLTGGTTTLAPATASIANLGELVRVKERPDGTTQDFVDVTEVEQLPQRDQFADRLVEFEWRGDSFHFVGATGDVELQITYYSSGTAPEAGTVGIDNSLNFLACRTAAIAGPPKGMWEVAEQLDVEARGKNKDGGGGHLHRLLLGMVRAQNRVPVQQPAYSAGGTGVILGGRPPFYR
jgi:hypothetical protein